MNEELNEALKWCADGAPLWTDDVFDPRYFKHTKALRDAFLSFSAALAEKDATIKNLEADLHSERQISAGIVDECAMRHKAEKEAQGLRENLNHWQESSKQHSASATEWHEKFKAAEREAQALREALNTRTEERDSYLDAVKLAETELAALIQPAPEKP